MNSFMRILLMYANEYDIKDESGRSVRGCTINYYFFGDDGSALQTQAQKVGYSFMQNMALISVYANNARLL